MKQINPWLDLISTLSTPRVITHIGGGGKTSLLYYLGQLLRAAGLSVVSTTTTKMWASPSMVEIHSLAEGHRLLQLMQQPEDMTLVTGRDPQNPSKVVGLPPQWIDELATGHPQVVFLVEGDGSAGRSIKGHLPHEPVIPATTGLLIPVIGVDVLGAPLDSQAVHRRERVLELLGDTQVRVITTEHVVQLLFHPEGYLRKCPIDSQILPFLNKVETFKNRKQAYNVAKQILSLRHPQICGVMLGSIQEAEFTYLRG